jgi:hypothetical protein
MLTGTVPREDLISAFADPRSAMFDGTQREADGRLPYWGNVAFRSLRTVMPAFKMVQLGVHMIGTSPIRPPICFIRKCNTDVQCTKTKGKI